MIMAEERLIHDRGFLQPQKSAQRANLKSWPTVTTRVPGIHRALLFKMLRIGWELHELTLNGPWIYNCTASTDLEKAQLIQYHSISREHEIFYQRFGSPEAVTTAAAALKSPATYGGIITDTKGLWKTFLALLFVNYIANYGPKVTEHKPTLVLAPNGVVLSQWLNAIYRNFPDLRIVLAHGEKTYRRKIRETLGCRSMLWNSHPKTYEPGPIISSTSSIQPTQKAAESLDIARAWNCLSALWRCTHP